MINGFKKGFQNKKKGIMILSVYRVDIEDMFDGDFAVGVTFIN